MTELCHPVRNAAVNDALQTRDLKRGKKNETTPT